MKTYFDFIRDLQERLAIELKVYSGTPQNSPSLEGSNTDSIRAALREISESGGNFEVVMVERVGMKPGESHFNRYNPTQWRTVS